MKIHRPIVGLYLTMLLTACGGGGSGGTAVGIASSSPPVLTGIFVDSPVNGLSYNTGTQSGKTNAKGEFSYVAGENITFSIGSIQLPAVLANATITPLDIAKTTDINHQVVSNILILLQSLDEDGIPSNGISISAAAATAAAAGVNFDVSPSAFSANAAVTKLVANSGSVNKTLVSEASAKAHFQNTLNGTTGTTKINVAPVANSGTAQSLLTGAVVTLDASASSDANNDTLTYLWVLTTKPSGSAAVLSSPVSAKPTFRADVAGAYIATLVVNDGKFDSTASTVTVTASVANAAPVANAGTAQSVLLKSTVTLNGAASSDANGDALTYAWTLTSKPTGSIAALANTTLVNPTFMPDVAGSFVASLVVNDGKLNSAASTVAVTAAVANVAPVANAGIAQSVIAGSVVTLDGSASSDANSDPLTHAWTLTSKPAGSAAGLTSATSAKPTFTADLAGTYVASLVVNDGKLNSDSATVTVTAAVGNVAPVANAGVAQNVVAGSGVTLDGSASLDANGDALTYAWTLTSKPTGSTAVLVALTSARPTFTADVAGTYVASLIANDGKLNSAASTITVTAAVANVAPMANAGIAQSVIAGSVVTLDGSASSDANGDALTYAWTLTSKPAGSAAALATFTLAKPLFTADLAGTYVATLIVNDGKLSSSLSTVSIAASVANAIPVANAGPAQKVATGVTVALDGSASSDANSDPLTYLWALISKPANSVAALNASTALKPTFTADLAGTYVASLMVNDGKVSSNVATISVTAAANTLTLLQPTTSFSGGPDTVLPMPYASSSSASVTVACVGSNCASVYDVATYRLSAAGQSYTISNLQAINLTNGSAITPQFSGLVNDQIIANGTTANFKLQSPFTRGATINLKYSFTVLETGNSFSYTVQLRTN